MRFALNPYEDQIDGHDREYLHMLGFVLGTVVAQSVKTDERYVVHCCCEKGSLLSNPVNSTNVETHDVTKSQDFTDPKTAQDIIRQLRGPGDVSFTVRPAQGSTWQRLN